MTDRELSAEIKKRIADVEKRIVVTKIACTRSIKSKIGDCFVGFSAAHDTVQEDAGGMGTGLVDAMDDQGAALLQSGMSIHDAQISSYILGMRVDLQALDHALAGSGITPDEHARATTAVRRNYMKMIARVVEKQAREG